MLTMMSDLYTAMKYDMHKIMQIILEDKNKIENIWSAIEWTLMTDVGRNMSYYIKWFCSQGGPNQNVDSAIRALSTLF